MFCKLTQGSISRGRMVALDKEHCRSDILNGGSRAQWDAAGCIYADVSAVYGLMQTVQWQEDQQVVLHQW